MLSLALLLSAVLSTSGTPDGAGGAVALADLARRYAAAYSASGFAAAHRGIPAWARKYNVNCSACHTPAIPRLNESGERFKWAGYRMPDELGEDVEVAKIQNYLAAGANAQYEWNKVEDEPTSPSTFSLPAITVFYAGPFGRHFSGFFEIEQGLEGEVERIAQVGGVWGKEHSYGGVRLGQMHYLAEWGLAGLDRPIGISTPLAVDEPVTGTMPFAFGGNRLSAQILNGVNAEGEGAVTDADNRKDFLITDQLLIDSAGSGIQGVAYYGTITGLDPAFTDLNSHYWRLGLTANKVIRDFEILGAVIYGKDLDLPVGGELLLAEPETKGVGTWVSGQYTFSRAAETPLTVFGRFEYDDPDTDVSDDASRRVVLGSVLPLNVPQYLRLALEYRRDMPQGGLPKTNNIIGEIWLNF
jgi:cytochrome c5